jgi:pimeloyl-ACP methyl ester carboxylesterase
MPQITANGISLEYDTHGDPSAPPLLLIMGLGAQMTLWPIELVEALVARGFHVIRYDNRDIGLSHKHHGERVPDVRVIGLKRMFGLGTRLPYRLSDMAADAVGLLDALGIERAHVVGASMGGMIAQLVAINHGHRVHSLTSIMSTTGNPRLPRPRPEALQVLLNRPPADAPFEAALAAGIRISRAIGSPGYPADEARLKERIERDYRRSFYPEGVGRQFAAIVEDGDRRKRLRGVSAPTLVIHGIDDPLVPVEGGRDTAAHIPGARLHEIAGMGHDLPLELVDEIADSLAAHAGG